MLKITIALFISLALISQDEPSPWVPFTSPEAGFSISFPGKPVETVSKKSSFEMHTFTLTAGRATYVASYSDYAPGKLNPKTALTANRDKFNKTLDATLLTSREITLDGHTGIEFMAETPAANVRSQLFLIGNRIYQTATFVFKDVDETRNVNRFFESFKFNQNNPRP